MNALQAKTEHFVRHEPCQACGSRDNLARYSNGSAYCFGCGKHERGTPARSGASLNTHSAESSISGLSSLGTASTGRVRGEVRPPPDDCGTYYTQSAIEWISKYNLTVADLIHHNVKWSPSREQLIYTFYGEGKDVVLWQARNFREGTTHKDRFYTRGEPKTTLAVYYPHEATRKGIIVEDCISGIKCARAGFAGIPCFGSSMSKQKLATLARLYNSLTVWLDEDKFKESHKLATQLVLLGVKAKVLHTNKDPKEYDETTIRNFANVPV